MTKVVINKCYGGFGLSHEAFVAYHARKGQPIYASEDNGLFCSFYKKPLNELPPVLLKEIYQRTAAEEKEARKINVTDYMVFIHQIEDRSDPDLIAVVEEFGKKANTQFSELTIVEVPDDVSWGIEEYDGIEWIAEAHQTWG